MHCIATGLLSARKPNPLHLFIKAGGFLGHLSEALSARYFSELWWNWPSLIC